MRLYACSDIHNDFDKHPPRDDVDFMLCAGDITDNALPDEVEAAREWLDAWNEECWTLFVPGNHDKNIYSHDSIGSTAANILDDVARLSPDYNVAGASMSVAYKAPVLAFIYSHMTANRVEEEEYYDRLPPADIVLSHSPPLGDTGYDTRVKLQLGSEALLRYIEAHQPKVVICGHVHWPRKREITIGKTRVYNVALEPKVIEL